MLSSRRFDDRGTSALELSIIAPSLLLLIFLAIQTGLYLYGRSVALQSAREGVSDARLEPTVGQCRTAADGIRTKVTGFAHDVGSGMLVAPAAAVNCDPDATGRRVAVTVSGHAISLIGLTFTINETAYGEVEKFTP